MRLLKWIFLSAFLLTSSGLVLAQPPSTPTRSQTEPAAKSPSPEEILEQTLHRIAAAYREMAVISPSDSPAVRDLRNQLARLAEEQDKAASAAKAMAAYHAELLALIRQSVTVSKTPTRANYGDSGFRK